MANGCNQNPIGACSDAEGALTIVNGINSHAEGVNMVASGLLSHTEGNGTAANGLEGVHIMGEFDTANELSYSWYLPMVRMQHRWVWPLRF